MATSLRTNYGKTIDSDATDTLIPLDPTQITSAHNRSNPQPGSPCHTLPASGHPPAVCITGTKTHALTAEGCDASEDGTGRGTPIVVAYRTTGNDGCYETGDRVGALNTGTDPSQHVVAYAIQERASCENVDAGPQGAGFRDGPAYTLEARAVPQAVAYQCHGSNVGPMGTLRAGNGNSSGGVPFIATGAVRRLTPRECERLQGFPDDWTAGESDTARYRMLGNAVAVPVAEWIARRIVANN